MVGEGGEDMRKRIRNEGGKGKTRREDQYEETRGCRSTGLEGTQRRSGQQEAGCRLAVEVDDARWMERVAPTVLVVHQAEPRVIWPCLGSGMSPNQAPADASTLASFAHHTCSPCL